MDAMRTRITFGRVTKSRADEKRRRIFKSSEWDLEELAADGNRRAVLAPHRRVRVGAAARYDRSVREGSRSKRHRAGRRANASRRPALYREKKARRVLGGRGFLTVLVEGASEILGDV